MYQSYKTDYSTESDNGIGYFVSLIQNFITEYVRRGRQNEEQKSAEISLSLPYGQKPGCWKEASARENWPQEWEHTRPGSARLSQGKPSGKKFIIPLIQELGGNMDDFKDFFKHRLKSRESSAEPVMQG